MQVEVLFCLLLVVAVVDIKNLLVLFKDSRELVDVPTHIKLRTIHKDNRLLVRIIALRLQHTSQLTHIGVQVELNVRLNAFKHLVKVCVRNLTCYQSLLKFRASQSQHWLKFQLLTTHPFKSLQIVKVYVSFQVLLKTVDI